MLFGAGEVGKGSHHRPQRLGVEAIAVDHYENAPGIGSRIGRMSSTWRMPARTGGKERPQMLFPGLNIATLEWNASATAWPNHPDRAGGTLTMNREVSRPPPKN
jgi:formate-dependent phosphoribosylglycinamide formyltransferase (GAR transformylase)